MQFKTARPLYCFKKILFYILNLCIKVFSSSDNSVCLFADLTTSKIAIVVSSTLLGILCELDADCSAVVDTVSIDKLVCSIALSICFVPLAISSYIALTKSAISGETIPFESRIICVAASYDAMSSVRPYRKGLPY